MGVNWAALPLPALCTVYLSLVSFLSVSISIISKNTKNWYTIDALGATFAIFGNFDNLDTLDPIYKLQDLKITLGS